MFTNLSSNIYYICTVRIPFNKFINSRRLFLNSTGDGYTIKAIGKSSLYANHLSRDGNKVLKLPLDLTKL